MLRSLILCALAALTACSSKHVVLMAPLTAPGSTFVCEATTEPGNCKPATESDPATETLSGSLYVNIPPECHGLVNKVIVRNLDTAKQSVLVVCAPPENVGGSTP